MKTYKNRLYEQLQQKLGNIEAPVSDADWDEINARLQENKNKGAAFLLRNFLIVAAFLIISATAFVTYQINKKQNKFIENTTLNHRKSTEVE